MAVFTKQIINELIKNDDFEYIFISGNDLDDEIINKILNSNCIFKQIKAPLPIFDQRIIPYLVYKYKPDACWFPSNTFPIIKSKLTKYIVTIHDLISLNKNFDSTSFYQKIAMIYRKTNILIGYKKVDEITSVSKTAYQDLHSKLILLNNKNVSDQNILFNSLNILDTDDANILKEYGISSDDKYIYSIVGNEKHKNLDLLINGFIKLLDIRPSFKLIISGTSLNPNQFNHNNIIFTKFLSEEQKVSLIKNAELFVFPSLVEGFGIPLIEGLYHNQKILVSDIPVFREIGKNFVSYFDPYDTDFLIKFYDKKSLVIDHDKAKKYIQNKFNVNKSVIKLKKLFKSA